MERLLLTLTEVPAGRAPLYQRIAHQMRSRIETGTWHPGDQLKAEAELAADLRVARGTLRAALGMLIESGHIEQHHGVGTFIADRGVSRAPAELLALETTSDASGRPAHVELLSCVQVEHGDQGYELDLSYRSRRVLHDSTGPVSVLDDLVLASVAPDLPHQDLVSEPFYAVLRDVYGVTVARCESTLAAAGAPAGIGTLLGVEAGTPLLHVSQLAFDGEGAIVDITEAWIRSDRHAPTVSVGAR